MQLRHNRTNRNDLAICPVAFPEGDQCAHWSSLKPVLCSNPFSFLSLPFSFLICYTHSIMRDCDHCQLMRNETCSGFTCLGFKPVGYIDVEVLKNAADRLDNSRRSRSKHSSRRVQEAAERVKHARLPEHQASSASLERGMTLWYKHKRTGELCHGRVVSVGTERFLFQYGTDSVWLDLNVIGSRLFHTKEDARRWGRTT